MGEKDFVKEIVKEAVKFSCSDIHFEQYKDFGVIRFRQHGELFDFKKLSKKEISNFISRIKVAASIDIDQKRKPQDGKISRDFYGIDEDLRISTVPTINGEKVVIRILYNNLDNLNLDNLGITKIKDLRELLKNKSGLIAICGPTGSGKSTTAFSMLKEIYSEARNIITVEDPVEYTLDRINQISVNNKIDLSFSNILRNILRQDPDIIFIGEIRDEETAKMALRAALTGHLIITTMHTSDSLSAISRLTDMGIEKYLIADVVKGVLSQRLVKVLCNHDEGEIKEVCPLCKNTGFKGRTLVSEILTIDEELKNGIRNGKDLKNILEKSKNFVSLEMDIDKKIKEGIINHEERYLSREEAS